MAWHAMAGHDMACHDVGVVLQFDEGNPKRLTLRSRTTFRSVPFHSISRSSHCILSDDLPPQFDEGNAKRRRQKAAEKAALAAIATLPAAEQVCNGMERYGTVWNGLERLWNGMERLWSGMERYGTVSMRSRRRPPPSRYAPTTCLVRMWMVCHLSSHSDSDAIPSRDPLAAGPPPSRGGGRALRAPRAVTSNPSFLPYAPCRLCR